jgi:hypothetical protein
MSVEQQVDALATSVENLKSAVVSKKATLDASVVDAQSATALAQNAKTNTLSARDQARAFKDAAYTAAQSAASAVAYQDLTALAETKAVTAVDVFIYDTAKDSDGGAWRHRCAGTSWFNEPLNTATRGARREFPAVALIVAEAAKITIYDADDPALPMWRVEPYAGLSIKALAALNAAISVATTVGLIVSDYAGNDLSTTEPVLPDAPIDPVTGLPVPTIAVATDFGVSIIHNDGSVADIVGNSAYTLTVACHFDTKNALYVRFGYVGNDLYGWITVFTTFPTSDTTEPINRNDTTPSPNVFNTYSKVALAPGITDNNWMRGAIFSTHGDEAAFRFATTEGRTGISRLAMNRADLSGGSLVAYQASDYCTGWLAPSTRGVFLADTDDADLVGDGTLTSPDRSAANKPLMVNGTITREPVATGAELVAYSGFAPNNYLEQPYNSALDFGTGDLCVMGWFYKGSSNSRHAIHRRQVDGLNNQGMFLILSGADNRVAFIGYDTTGSGVISLTTPTSIDPSSWVFVTATRSGSVGALYIDGKLVAVDGTAAGEITSPSSDATLVVGGRHDHQNSWEGSIALLRISATALTADQIAKIYEDERFLFQENAACTLYGASDAVTALAHDPDTGLLHVGTSAGRSVFHGLRRVANTTAPVTTAIAAAGGMVVEE